MGILEIFLLLIGAVLAVLSFVLPASKEGTDRETKVLAKEEIKTIVETEMKDIRQHVDDVVDEAVGYAVEKTERSLERLTNEKIMAVNEYSDTVLQEIHKNHDEAMFLYDMLNTKHDNLKDTVSEASKMVQEAQETMEKMVPFQENLVAGQIVPVQVVEIPSAEMSVAELQEQNISEQKTSEIKVPEFARLDLNRLSNKAQDSVGKEVSDRKVKKKDVSENLMDESVADTIKEWDFLADAKEPGTNNNEQILNLHKQGKSTVAIAKALGLGVGEVKLVIDLYKNS